MAGIWSLPNELSAQPGLRAHARGRVSRALCLGALSLALLLLVAIAPSARGAKGSIGVRARVLSRGDTAAVEDLRSRWAGGEALGELGEAWRLDAGSGTRARELDGGRVRLSLEGPAESPRLTVEYLAN